MFAERMRYTVARTSSLTVSAGVAMVAEGDDAKVFLTRADSALYAAKAAGRNTVYCHNGEDAFPAKSQDLMAESTASSGRKPAAQSAVAEPVVEKKSDS